MIARLLLSAHALWPGQGWLTMTDTASRRDDTLGQGGIAGGAIYVLHAVSSCHCPWALALLTAE